MLVDGKIGEFCIFARQERGGEDWYIGGINADEPREVEVPLSMLEDGQTYTATIYRDGEQADWLTNPYDYRIESQTVTSSDKLQLRMASGGGFAVRIAKE
jgi:alpha-glucosidase